MKNETMKRRNISVTWVVNARAILSSFLQERHMAVGTRLYFYYPKKAHNGGNYAHAQDSKAYNFCLR